VTSFGRDDGVFLWDVKQRNSSKENSSKDSSRSPSGMTTRKTNARATTKYGGLSAAHQTVRQSDASVEVTRVFWLVVGERRSGEN
jgi:hypothetical protein